MFSILFVKYYIFFLYYGAFLRILRHFSVEKYEKLNAFRTFLAIFIQSQTAVFRSPP